MGISSIKLGLLAGGCLLLHLCAAHLCPSGHQYWSSSTESCVNCSKCTTPEKPIVVRPCQGHVDTECGQLTDLNIDWSWLTKKDSKKHNAERTHKHPSLDEKEYLDKDGIDDGKEDLFSNPDLYSDEVTTKKSHHGHKHEHQHHKHTFPKHHKEGLEKHHKNHHTSSDKFVIDYEMEAEHHRKRTEDDDILDYIEQLKHSGRKEDLEKEWSKLLAQSKTRLQHRKEDLIKTLREEGKPKSEKHLKHKTELDDYDLDREDERFPSQQKDSPRKPLSKMDLRIFEELVNEEHKRQMPSMDYIKLLKSGDGANRIQHDLKHLKKHHREEVPLPVDSFDYRSVVPTHRLFLGEPSTISEIMDQDFLDETEEGKFDKETSKFKVIPWDEINVLEEREPKMSPVQFTATERFVWDWQAVALSSAVAACLLFFAVVAVYSVLHARQWRRMKGHLNSDMEEMSARISLMHQPTLGSSAADGSNANHYLENLLAGKKLNEKKTNIYIQKPSTS